MTYIEATDGRYYLNPIINCLDGCIFRLNGPIPTMSVCAGKTTTELSARKRGVSGLYRRKIRGRLIRFLGLTDSFYTWEVKLSGPIPVPKRHEGVINRNEMIQHPYWFVWNGLFNRKSILDVFCDGPINIHFHEFTGLYDRGRLIKWFAKRLHGLKSLPLALTLERT